MDRHFPPMGSTVQASPSNSLPTKSHASARKNAKWNPRENRVFIAACEAVIADGHHNGKCFTKHGWDTLLRLFNSNSGHDWSKRQLKNHWDSLRQKHKRFQESNTSLQREEFLHQRSGGHERLSERVATKLDKLVGPEVPDAKTCIKEMLVTGRL